MFASMRRKATLGRAVVATLAVTVALGLGLSAAAAAALPLEQAAGCRFTLGFAALREQVGAAAVGDCLEDERHDGVTGDALQRTTGGLLVWRKSDNWTAFTDGARTWLAGPNGLQSRPNSQRFAWEGPERLAWPTRAVTTDEAAQLARAEAARVLGVPPEQVTVQSAEAVRWSDASLGCAQPDRIYAAVIVEGLRVVLGVAGRPVHVHAAPGQALLCPSPTQTPPGAGVPADPAAGPSADVGGGRAAALPVGAALYIDDRSGPVAVLRSYVNALNRREYARAYGYWEPAAAGLPPFEQFAAGFADTRSVQLWTGEVRSDAGAGQLYHAVYVVLWAERTGGQTQTFGGCYELHLAQPGVQAVPPFRPMGIRKGTLRELPGGIGPLGPRSEECGPR